MTMDLWVACQVCLLHGLNMFLNGHDTECATTMVATLFALQQVLYMDWGVWQGPPLCSDMWNCFLHSWQMMACTAHCNGLTIHQRDI